MTTTTTAEVLEHMSDADYFADPAVNHSTLKVIVERTPAHLRHMLDHGSSEPTTDMEFGSAVHSWVLGGPDIWRIDARDWRTKDAQMQRDDAREVGAIPLLKADYDRSKVCADAVHSHPIAGKLVSTLNMREVVIKWHDGDIVLKAKIDGISGRIVWDLKTTYNADADAFGRSAAKYGYASQAAFYLDAARAAGITDPTFLFVVVEREPPHLVNVIKLDDYDCELGARRNARALNIYRECVTTGVWPGFPDGIQTAQLPRWWEITEEAE